MAHKLTRIHVLLFIATFLTTLIAGAFFLHGVIPWETPENIYLGLPFSLTLLFILLVHEMSHYLASRKHGVPATLPYFIPAPTIFGTFGAIIKMKPPIPDRRTLIDIGAAGPIGGFIVAVIAVIIGLSRSEVRPIEAVGEGIAFGDSLLLTVLTRLVLDIDPEKYTIMLNPVLFAGWIGLLVTSLNLLPIGQLDGGHITYALFGEKHEMISKAMLPVLVILGIVFWPGWLVWAVLMLVIGYRHPPVVYPHIQLDRKRKLIGWVSLAIFILTFTPVPVQGL
ncbi:MAG: site-2 protease family protein [Nitrospiraceae bacterium]|nr:MAG: site-2 protease family protein [Nitrospiraceae bacterium]